MHWPSASQGDVVGPLPSPPTFSGSFSPEGSGQEGKGRSERESTGVKGPTHLLDKIEGSFAVRATNHEASGDARDDLLAHVID